MSLPEIVAVLAEHERQAAETEALALDSRQLASASKWSRNASSAYTRRFRQLRRAATPAKSRVVRLSPADLRAALSA